jgi:uncharacterized protein (TIGR00725 family)
MSERPERQPTAAVIGPARADAELIAVAEEVGRLLVDKGLRVVTGGLGGAMEAASRGARSSTRWATGTVIGILPTYDPHTANPWVDVIIPTGLGHARNIVVVASADVVLAVGGRAGTLSEIALAWTLGRRVIAVAGTGGWTESLAGRTIDDRRQDRIEGPLAPEEAASLALALALRPRSLSREF